MKALFSLTAVLVFSLVTALLTSCSKDSDSGGQYFLSAKIDGVELKNIGYTVATFTDLPAIGFKTCDIQGSTSATATTDIIKATIIDVAPITTKQYTETNIGGAIQATITYTDKNGVVYSSAYNTTSDAVITITGLNVNDVTGTFSGSVSNSAGTSTVAITDGSFVVKRLH